MKIIDIAIRPIVGMDYNKSFDLTVWGTLEVKY
jgi:hypothetical protein